MSHVQNIIENCVSPELCESLVELGLTSDTTFRYRKYPEDTEYEFVSRIIDPLQIYATAELPMPDIEDNRAKAVVGYKEIPAFLIADMLRVIPSPIMTQTNNLWEVFTETKLIEKQSVSIIPSSSRHLPDAVGLFVAQMLEKDLITPEQANALILKPLNT